MAASHCGETACATRGGTEAEGRDRGRHSWYVTSPVPTASDTPHAGSWAAAWLELGLPAAVPVCWLPGVAPISGGKAAPGCCPGLSQALESGSSSAALCSAGLHPSPAEPGEGSVWVVKWEPSAGGEKRVPAGTCPSPTSQKLCLLCCGTMSTLQTGITWTPLGVKLPHLHLPRLTFGWRGRQLHHVFVLQHQGVAVRGSLNILLLRQGCCTSAGQFLI